MRRLADVLDYRRIGRRAIRHHRQTRKLSFRYLLAKVMTPRYYCLSRPRFTMAKEKIVFCAGPHFNPEEKQGLEQITDVIEAGGFATYLPHRDGIDEGGITQRYESLLEAYFALEVYQIASRCDAMILNLNGRVPDEGGVFKASFAYTAGTPVILYKNDNRSVFHGSENSMILGLSHDYRTVRKIRKIPTEISRALQSADNRIDTRVSGASGLVQQTILYGEKVWSLLNEIREQRSEDNSATDLLQLLAYRIEQTTSNAS